MIRAKVWFRCAAMRDPVQPCLVEPARLGWRGKFRQVDLTIQRSFSGEELARRMKGWVTADPAQVCEAVRPHGWLKVFDDGGLVVEVDDEARFQALQADLLQRFGEQVELEVIRG